MRNIKLTVEYDGTDFVGWQRQKNDRSVQGELEKAVAKLIGEIVYVIGAGRTDSGVHAKGQVANFRCQSNLSENKIKDGLNALLAEDVSILAVEEVPLDFHARYSAKKRFYKYTITKQRSALLRRYSWFVKYKLDYEILAQCAEKIKKTTDFKIFCLGDSNVKHYLCEVSESKWIIDDCFLYYEIMANRFLHGMVRSLVGYMIDIARGYLTLNSSDSTISFNNKIKSWQVAPANGLVLESVQY